MRDVLGESLIKLKTIRARGRRLTALVLALSLLVSLDVYWTLRQPGLTLAGDADCGLVEHTHDEHCGTETLVCGLEETVHIHSDACYTLPDAESRRGRPLVCTLTQEPHQHQPECYRTEAVPPVEQTELVCTEPAEPHVHGEGCYTVTHIPGQTETALICTEPTEAHVHSDSCYTVTFIPGQTETTLVCTEPEAEPHSHTEACYSITVLPEQTETTLVCTDPDETHIHLDACYETTVIPEQQLQTLAYQQSEQGHTHSDTCYQTTVTPDTEQVTLTCTVPEAAHEHGDTCYKTTLVPGPVETILVCPLEQEPHEHTDTCFAEYADDTPPQPVLTCGLEEGGHVHSESCRQIQQTCTLVPHVHTLECYSDDTADTETLLDWQLMFADYPYTDSLRQNLVGIAQSQVGYTESSRNFERGTDGVRRGYTRYGAWYGTPYRDWSAMFVSFCLSYAGADPDQTPGNSGAASMAQLWEANGRYAPVGSYTPVAGDLVFFTDNTVGIVTQVFGGNFNAICGDIEDTVAGMLVPLEDSSIAGWGITELPTAPTEEAQPPPSQEAQPPPGQEEQPPSGPDPTEVDILDISNGPAVFLFIGSSREPMAAPFSLRLTRAATDLLPYLEANGGSYFFTLLDTNNQELPKDAAGNYVVTAGTRYKLTISFHSPDGFLPGTYQYQIPDGPIVDGGEGQFILTNGTVVGDWSVTEDGLITLTFNEQMDAHSEITISATMGIRFLPQEDPLDFDGKITVTVEKAPADLQPTVLSKWGSQGNPDAATKNDPSKLYWTVLVTGNKDSQIPGSILTDRVINADWIEDHSYTASDMAGGLTIGVSEPDPVTGVQIGWHSWTVYPGDPNLTWTEKGWSYQFPEVAHCIWCGDVTLGNQGWSYYVEYSSTPDPSSVAGSLAYMNQVQMDGQAADGWASFTHTPSLGEIVKQGSFLGDGAGGAFQWEFQATVPGMQPGQKADYFWFIMDYMDVRDAGGNLLGYAHNDVDKSTVTVTTSQGTASVPRVQDATPSDQFAWHHYWADDHGDGIYYAREINLLCRCHCTEETCMFWTDGKCASEYWYEGDDGVWYANGFCQCWTATENVTFTFAYRTEDLGIVDDYGGLGNRLRNEAVLYHKPNGNTGTLVDNAQSYVKIPGIFAKDLTQDFDGYTAHYRITVNEARLVLTNGAPLTIRDAMSQTLAYISGSLVITTEDGSGNIHTLRQGDDYTVSYNGTGSITDKNGTPLHVLDIVILQPQPVMYILDYDTALVIPPGTTQAVKYVNSAEVSLWGVHITADSPEKVYADINIAAKSHRLDLYKTDTLTGDPLPGAQFGLYHSHGGLITTETTDANGALRFQTSVIEGIILQDHTLYYVQELQAPDGYLLDDTKQWIVFCDSDAAHCDTCQTLLPDADGTRIPKGSGGDLTLGNELLGYELPATGGPGIYPLILASAVLILTPLVYSLVPRRKRGRRGTG